MRKVHCVDPEGCIQLEKSQRRPNRIHCLRCVGLQGQAAVSDLGSNPSSTPYLLCEPGQVPQPSQAFANSPLKWE